jgi:hypothetical protein
MIVLLLAVVLVGRMALPYSFNINENTSREGGKTPPGDVHSAKLVAISSV